MRQRLFLFALAFSGMFPLVVVAQPTEEEKAAQPEKFGAAAESEFNKRLAAIEEEIKETPQHPWAGSYYQGDGLGANLRLTLAPKSGFVFAWAGCLGVYDRNWGEIEGTDRGSLRLLFSLKNDRRGFRGAPDELLPVAWGGRHYLVPVNRVIGFCNEVNSKKEPRKRAQGHYFLRQGDWEKQVIGSPVLPKEYQLYLLDDPIVAEITAVGPTDVEGGARKLRQEKTHVRLSVGKRDGVLVGMEFYTVDREPGRMLFTVTVTSTEEQSSEAILSQYAWDENQPERPAVGWKVSTLSPLVREE